MDTDALKGSIKGVLKRMTPQMQIDASKVFDLVGKHIKDIEKMGPDVMPILNPVIETIAMEWAMKMLDKKAVETAFREAFAECGIMIPDAPSV